MAEITTKQLSEKLKENPNLNIIDVREDDEVAEGKIPGARHIALGNIPTQVDALDKNEQYYIVCRSGGRSGRACEYLTEQGYDVINVDGGMLAWEDEVEL